VSKNHALVWGVDESTYVRDLASRNGTWLLLPRDRTVRIEAGEIVLQLAQRPGADAGDNDEPAPLVWTGSSDFAKAVARAVGSWLTTRGVEATVTVSRPGEPEEPQVFRAPLASGRYLEIFPRGTTTANWPNLLERVWRWIARQNAEYRAEEDTRREGMILVSRPIRQAHREVVEAAHSANRTLLLTGPSGSGKEKLAEVFHRHSGRSGPLVAINCSMLNKELLRSELFGAEPGAFTGATRRIVGAVERAQGGTLFLDEIGEMDLELQPSLLRFLDRREYESLGQYGRTQRADVSIVAATNRDLREAVRAGTFRVDLWFRLSVHVVEVPPLRVRWDDIAAFLDTVAVQDQSHSLREALSPAALEALRSYAWEGNFRELAAFVQRLPREAGPGTIDAATCLRALERGSLRKGLPPAQEALAEAADVDWAHFAQSALAAFVEDHGRKPTSWDDQKQWNEKYLKPLLFFHMSGAPPLASSPDKTDLPALAVQASNRLQADRGTALKQLTRYYARFRR
jgi:DNA-binding NtrC family response regulator